MPFRVVGVMARKGQDPQGRDQDDAAFAPYTSVQKKLLGNTRVQVAYVSAVSQDATYTAQTQIADLLRQRHKLGRARRTTSPSQHVRRGGGGERDEQRDDDAARGASRASRSSSAASAS
jgi:hypothetical protein